MNNRKCEDLNRVDSLLSLSTSYLVRCTSNLDYLPSLGTRYWVLSTTTTGFRRKALCNEYLIMYDE